MWFQWLNACLRRVITITKYLVRNFTRNKKQYNRILKSLQCILTIENNIQYMVWVSFLDDVFPTRRTRKHVQRIVVNCKQRIIHDTSARGTRSISFQTSNLPKTHFFPSNPFLALLRVLSIYLDLFKKHTMYTKQ